MRPMLVPCVPPGTANHSRATKHDPLFALYPSDQLPLPQMYHALQLPQRLHSGRRSYVSIRQYTGGVRAEGLGGARMARQAVESCCAVGRDEPERLTSTYERAQAKSARAGTQLTVTSSTRQYTAVLE
jgi:hypothetical protein